MIDTSRAKIMLLADKVFKKGNFEIAVIDEKEYIMTESGVMGPYSYTQLITDSIIGADRTNKDTTRTLWMHSVNEHEIVYLDGRVKELNSKNYRRTINAIAKNVLVKDDMREYLKGFSSASNIKQMLMFDEDIDRTNGPAKYFSDRYAIRLSRRDCSDHAYCIKQVNVHVGLNSISDTADGIGVWDIVRKEWKKSPSTMWYRNCCEGCEVQDYYNL